MKKIIGAALAAAALTTTLITPSVANAAGTKPGETPNCENVVVIGDSLTVGIKNYETVLKDAGFNNVDIRAVGGRQIVGNDSVKGGMQFVKESGAAEKKNVCWVMAMGTNDVHNSGLGKEEMKKRIQDLNELTGDSGEIFWFELVSGPNPQGLDPEGLKDERMQMFNEQLREVMKETDNMAIIKWRDVLDKNIPNQADRYGGDDLHYSAKAYELRAKTTVDALKEPAAGAPAQNPDDTKNDGKDPQDRGGNNGEPAAAPQAETKAQGREGEPSGGGELNGKVVYLDPGHGGVGRPEKTVNDGRTGTMKMCYTDGTASNSNLPEHTFNWNIAQEIKKQLEAKGAKVLLTRDDDTGKAPCLDERAKAENESDADLVVSIHADGNTEGNRGFHISTVQTPLPDNDLEGSKKVADSILAAMKDAGYQPSNYLGTGGLNPRDDLAGLNLSSKPKALVEYGNMRDSQDIKTMDNPEGVKKLADATVAGIENALK